MMADDIAVASYHLSQVELVSQWGCNSDIATSLEVVDDNGERFSELKEHVDDAVVLCPSL